MAEPLIEFAKCHHNRERIWIVEKDRQVAGSVAIIEASDAEAQLRWLLLHPTLRGQGWGKKLGAEAIRFCRSRGYRTVFLRTVRVLEGAAGLYKSSGFRLSEETIHRLWGTEVIEQRYDFKL